METKNNQTSKDKRQIAHLGEWCKGQLQAHGCYCDSFGYGRGFAEVYVEMQNPVQKRGNRYMQALHLSAGFGDCEMAKTN